MDPVRHGSLFSGYGGIDRAIADVFGAETAWVSDVDPGANRILAHRYPDAPNLGDITAVDWSTIEPVDIVSGGSPCQDLSTAGRRAGMTPGTRSNLWVSMREAIAVLKPTYVVWENVRGAMSAKADSGLEHCPGCMGDPGDGKRHLRALGRVLGDLADLGYDAQWHGLRAADVGACHGRWRVFVLAYTNEQRHERRWGARDGWTRPADSRGEAIALLPTPTTEPMTGNGHARNLGKEVKLLPTPTVADSLGGHERRGGLITGQVSWGDYAEAIARHEHAFGQPAPAPTEPGPKGNPRLSARFVEWMMMLPAGWVTDVPGVTRNQALKALGNGVVPPQAAAALRLMLDRMTLT